MTVSRKVACRGVVISLLMLLVMLSSACSGQNGKRAVYVLVDIPVSTDEEFDSMRSVIRHLLAKLRPGESLALARINGESFTDENIVARISFDPRPSKANAQKRAFLVAVDELGQKMQSSTFTDMTGGLLQAVEYLNESGTEKKYILMLSDLEEEVRYQQVQDFPVNFNGAQMLVMHPFVLSGGSIDSKQYLLRIDHWRARVEAGNGSWREVDSLDRLDLLLK